MFTWNAKVQSTDAQGNPSASTITDQGVQLNATDGTSGKVTTASWQASFALAEDFRNAFLLQIAKMTPSEVFNGSAQSVLSIQSVADPKPMGKGQWQVDVVANLLIFDSRYPRGELSPSTKVSSSKPLSPQ